MKAHLSSVRIAPKKLNVIAQMIRGLSVPEAMTLLDRTHKKGAKILEALLKSAMANASHNDKQDPQMLIVKTLVVNQATSYRRGVPMARGRVRPMRKFLSHATLTLGVAVAPKEAKVRGVSSQKAKKPVQDGNSKGRTSAKKESSSSSK